MVLHIAREDDRLLVAAAAAAARAGWHSDKPRRARLRSDSRTIRGIALRTSPAPAESAAASGAPACAPRRRKIRWASAAAPSSARRASPCSDGLDVVQIQHGPGADRGNLRSQYGAHQKCSTIPTSYRRPVERRGDHVAEAGEAVDQRRNASRQAYRHSVPPGRQSCGGSAAVRSPSTRRARPGGSRSRDRPRRVGGTRAGPSRTVAAR